MFHVGMTLISLLEEKINYLTSMFHVGITLISLLGEKINYSKIQYT